MAPSRDPQEALDQRETEGIQGPEEKGVHANRALEMLRIFQMFGQSFEEQQSKSFICLQVIQDAQVCQDYQGHTLFKFHTKCRRGKQVGHHVVKIHEKFPVSQPHNSSLHHFSPSSSPAGNKVIGRHKKHHRQAHGG